MMVFASTGLRIICTRIISSAIPPYTVDILNSKRFRDGLSTSSMFLQAIIIIDLENAKCLIYDYSRLQPLLGSIYFGNI
jgi:hypothetical protein